MGQEPGERVESLLRRHGGVATWQQAVEGGLSRHTVQWALRTGVLHPLRRGVYTTSAEWAQASPEVRHGLEILGRQRVRPELIACATSAAIVLGLPTPSGPPPQPELTAARPDQRMVRGEPGARGRRGGQITRRSLLTDSQVWTLTSGIRVTSAVRTVLDCARGWDRPWGLAIADAAIARWDVEPAALVQAARERSPIPGSSQVQWVADHARAEVESPLESLPRAVIVLAGLPEPTPQVWLRTRAGSFRADLLDEPNRTITEADGKGKYADREDLWQEKRREDALRDAGFEVVRFTFHDYRNQPAWLATYRRALNRAQHRSPRQ